MNTLIPVRVITLVIASRAELSDSIQSDNAWRAGKPEMWRMAWAVAPSMEQLAVELRGLHLGVRATQFAGRRLTQLGICSPSW